MSADAPGRVHVRRMMAVAGLAASLALAVLWPPRRAGLVVYAVGEAAPRVAAAFTAETGEPVTVVRLLTGVLLARVAAEGRRPNWTLAWFDGDMPAAALDEAGLLAHGVAPAADWTATGRDLLTRSGAWTPVGLTLAGVFVGPKAIAPASRPTAPAARRRAPRGPTPLGLPDPALSGPAYSMIAGVLEQGGGWPAGEADWLRLRDQGLRVAATSPNVVQDLRGGEIARGLIQSSTAFALAAQDASIQVAVPRPAILLPSVIVMTAAASPAQRAIGERFIRFVLSRRGQQVRLRSGRVDAYYWPVTADAGSPPKTLPPLASLSLRHLDPFLWGRLQPAVTDWFEDEVAPR